MISRIVSWFNSRVSSQTAVTSIERMEDRLLLSAAPAQAQSISTDNRGYTEITFNIALDPSTVNTRTVQVHTAGADGIFGTADDVKITGRVKLTLSGRRIIWRPAVSVPFAPYSTYSVKVSAKTVTDVNGNHIDGEFNGPGNLTGNGVAGGDLLFLGKRDKSTSPTARFATVEGKIDVSLDTVNTPLTYANFLSYANAGLYDYTFFHRSVPGFVIQGGGFVASLTDNTAAGLSVIPTTAPVQNEFHTSNTRGTIAMAKLGGDPNSATDQWFFNTADNSTNLDSQNGGFTVFGTVKYSSGLSVMDAINALTQVDLSTMNNSNASITGAMTQTPVVNSSTTAANVQPLSDLVIVSRVSIRDKYVAFPIPPAVVSAQATPGVAADSGTVQPALVLAPTANATSLPANTAGTFGRARTGRWQDHRLT